MEIFILYNVVWKLLFKILWNFIVIIFIYKDFKVGIIEYFSKRKK